MQTTGNDISLLTRITAHPDFICREGKMQIMIYFKGEKLGGYNTRANHWYLSKKFVTLKAKAEDLLSFGLQHIFVPNSKHEFWMSQGLNAEVNFGRAIAHLTSTEI